MTPYADWPLPVGRVRHRHDLTFVHSAEPGGFSVDDFRRIPDDRVELVGGVAVVRPEPSREQQQVVDDLYKDLAATCPAGLAPFTGAHGVQVGPATVLRPDVLVRPPENDGAVPVLVVEVRPDYDPLYRWGERRAKFHGYRDAGVASYWTVNPDTGTVAVYELNYLVRPRRFTHGEVCKRGRQGGWRLWADPNPNPEATRYRSGSSL